MQFANDTLNLVLVNSSINRSKGGQDAGQWWPPHNQCWFARRIIEVRNAYQLSVDPIEKDSLAEKINACDSFEMEITSTPYPNFLTDSTADVDLLQTVQNFVKSIQTGYRIITVHTRLDWTQTWMAGFAVDALC